MKNDRITRTVALISQSFLADIKDSQIVEIRGTY